MDALLLYVIANIVSVITIISSLFMKVPQILTLLSKKSTRGMYIQAMLMEIACYTISTLYNFKQQYSLMTYLEYPILLMQQWLLIYITLKIKKQLNTFTFIGILTYLTVVLMLLGEIIPKTVLGYLIYFCLPLSGVAKVTYVYGIIQTKNADCVSLTTWALSVFTNFSRCFTVYVDSADKKLMFNFIVSVLLSLSVYLTAMYYKRADLKQYKSYKYARLTRTARNTE